MADPEPLPPQRPLSEAPAAALAAQVAELAKAGVPLEAGLRAAAAELSAGRLSRSLRALADALAAGWPLEKAISEPAVGLPAHIQALLLAAVRSGRLAEVLDMLLRLRQNGRELRRRLWIGLSYPLMLVTIMLGIFLVLQGYVAPMFGAIFKDFGATVPPLTHLALSLSGMRAVVFVVVLVGGAVLVGVLACVPNWPMAARVLYLIPVIGPMWRWHRQAEFARLLAMLLDQRVPLPEALMLAGGASADAGLADAARRLAGEVAVGRPLADGLADQPALAPTLSPLVAWGEQHTAVGPSLSAAADLYEARVQTCSQHARRGQSCRWRSCPCCCCVLRFRRHR